MPTRRRHQQPGLPSPAPDLVIMADTMPLIPDEVDRIAVQDWWGASLREPSVLKPTLMTIDLPLILKKLGQLTPSNQARLRQTIVLIFS